MLSENIKAFRQAKGLSQEELAAKLNVVRQTVSKWERGLSVPDSELLLSLSQSLAVPVSTLLGETVSEVQQDDLRNLSEKLAAINGELARRKAARRRILHWSCLALCVIIAAAFAAMVKWGNPYSDWDAWDPEFAVLGVIIHALQWGLIRVAPIGLIGSIVGFFLTREKE